MSSDVWPSPDAPLAPLPRLEDLPLSDQGYDREAVRQAFDSFYRHAAQLDASLRALEAVEVFRRDADALRNDLRALRALGLAGGQPEPAWATQSYERPRAELPGVLLRLTAESALIIAVAVVAGVAHLHSSLIVALMAGAFVIVALSEWLATRARFVPPAVAFLPARNDGEPAPYVEAPPNWGPAGPGLSEDTEPEALTVIAVAGEHVDPWEQGEVTAEPELEPEPPEPELAERGGMFRRRRR